MLFVTTSRGSILPFTIIQEALWYDCRQRKKKTKNNAAGCLDGIWCSELVRRWKECHNLFLILTSFQIKLMSLCRSPTLISFWRILGFICYHDAKINFHNFHSWHFLRLDSVSKNDISAAPATCIVFDLMKSLLFLFSSSAILRSCEIFKWHVRGWGV